jgi:amino acid permease
LSKKPKVKEFTIYLNYSLGTVWTASAHIITAVIGSGVLSLAWAIAQLGWVAGPAVMLLFSFVIYYTSTLLADCYRSGDPMTGKRNYTYMDAVHANLGKSFFFKIPVLKCSFY